MNGPLGIGQDWCCTLPPAPLMAADRPPPAHVLVGPARGRGPGLDPVWRSSSFCSHFMKPKGRYEMLSAMLGLEPLMDFSQYG